MTIGSIFADAVRTAISGQARVFDYGDEDTFVDLWTMGEDGCPIAFGTGDGPGREKEAAGNASGDPNQERSAQNGEPTAGKTIIIVWDGRALSKSVERTEPLEPHLTPMDWVLAFSINALAQDEVPECADVAIHIIDLTGRDHTAWSMRMRHQLLAEMPWVTLHAPLIPNGPYRSGYRPVLDDCGSLLESNGTGWKLRAGTATLKACVSRGYGRNLAGLSGQWASTLVQTHDHHDLNNLVGPWILLGITPETASSLFAFWNRLRWSGLLPEISSGQEPKNITMEELDVLTIDDQLDVGWNHVIRHLFGAENNEEEAEGCFESIRSIGSTGNTHLYGSNSARTLLASLMKEGAFEKRCFDSPIPRSGSKRPWLLVLDLLLFPGGSSAERDWLGELLDIATGISTDSSNLAWRGFSEDELDGVENWLGSGNVDAPAYNTALSLLPRLCALRWPSVPILLFSGTSRRALTDKLAAYRNIFLVPQKPNLLSGNAAEESEAFLGGWRRELDSAMGLIAVQRKLLQLQRKGKTAQASAHGTGDGGASTGDDAAKQSAEAHQCAEEQNDNCLHRHLTIAFEESGDFNKDDFSAIGGVVIDAQGKNESAAKRESFKFLEELRKEGVNFYDHPPAYTQIEKYGNVYCNLISKNAPINTHVSKVLTQFKCSIKIGSFRSRIGKPDYVQDGRADSTYMKWLARTLELLLSEFFGSLGYEPETTTLSIWLPTRAVEGTKEMALRWDLHFDPIRAEQVRMNTVGGHSVAYQIMLRALEDRPRQIEILDRCDVKVRKIPYYDTGSRDVNRTPLYSSALQWYCSNCATFVPQFIKSAPRLKTVGPSEFENVMFMEYFNDVCHFNVKKDKRETLTGYRHAYCNRSRCRRKEFLAADYSVAQHLADAALTAGHEFPSEELGMGNIVGTISFDVDAGQALEEFLSAGRAFDRGQMFEAFAICYWRGWFPSALGARNGLVAPVGGRLVKECQKYADCISGDEITRLAASHTGKRWRITLTGYRDEKAVVDTTTKIFEDWEVDRPQIRSGMTRGGRPSLSFEIGEAERATVMDPLKSALQDQQAVVNSNPL